MVPLDAAEGTEFWRSRLSTLLILFPCSFPDLSCHLFFSSFTHLFLLTSFHEWIVSILQYRPACSRLDFCLLLGGQIIEIIREAFGQEKGSARAQSDDVKGSQYFTAAFLLSEC